MKIRLRLALLSILCAASALIVCGTLLMRASAKSSVTSAKDNALAELSMIETSFRSAVSSAGGASLSDTAKDSMLVYLFRDYAEGSMVTSRYALMREGETLYNNSGYALDALLAGEAQRDVSIDGRRLFAAGIETRLLGESSHIYILRDVTSVYEGIAALRARFTLICLAALLASAAVIVLVTFRALRPLEALTAGAAAMMNGDYAARIPVRGRDEIAVVSEGFNRMADAVERHIDEVTATAEERRMLLGALTHELKTPMTAIIGYAESLERARLNPAQREKAVSFIFREGRRLERLTQKMMRLITLTDGEEIECRDTPASELFAMVEETLTGSAAHQGATLRFCGDGARYAVDPDLMASVLINLVDNACAAGAKNVTVRAEERVLSVTDDGCGIPADIIEKVAQPFFMADRARSRRRGSAGLGLALVSRIAALHGARLTIESGEGGGTTVQFIFPQ